MKKNKNEIISIIVPVYNVEKYLSECIDSILHQTYKDIEVLLIDDGSTDSSYKICLDYVKRDPRIKVFQKQNEGLGKTRNYGVKKASGEYIMFVDADDYISVDCVENLYNEVRKGFDTAIGGYTKVKNNGEVIFEENYKNETFYNDDVKQLLLPRFIGSLPDKKDSIFTTANAKLYTKDFFTKNNLTFPDEKEFQSEDLRFQFDYFSIAKKVSVIRDSIYYYRYTPNSITTTYKATRFAETKKVYNGIKELIKNKKLPETAYLRLDKMFFVQLKSSLSQERRNTEKKGQRNRIKSMVEDQLTQTIAKKYPTDRMPLKQKIFVNLVKNKRFNIIYFMVKWGLC